MEIRNKTIVVTGSANGIGRALALRFAMEGARHVVCADIDIEGACETARAVEGTAIKTDVSREDDIVSLIKTTESDIGPIDLFCSNAGVLTRGGVEVGDEAWQKIWDINVMSQVWAARHLVPLMIERGGGYLLNTSSAAGLLNQIGAAPYGVTKHASVGLAEWLAITYGDKGIKVSVLCPQAVRTEMTRGSEGSVSRRDGLLEPEDVARACVAAITSEEFLILPHETVRDYIRLKAENYDRWIAGMRKLNRSYKI